MSDYVTSNNLGMLIDVTSGDISSYKSSNKLISFFGRTTYNYNSKYFLTATLRRDGSTKFGANNEWGIFPSASLGWTIKEEAFLKDVDFISQLKLRVGYGLAGNQEFESYRDIQAAIRTGLTINPETGDPAVGMDIANNSNLDLQWEQNSEMNIGLDWAIWNNRISGSFEYYDKRTNNLLYAYSMTMPPALVRTTWGNAGVISNAGYEANIEAYIIQGKKFEWKTNFSISKNVQKVVKLSSDVFSWSESDKKQGWLNGRGLVGDNNWSQYLEEGYALGTFYMPEYAGLSGDGKFLFYTAAGGITREVSAAERRVVGHALPDFEIGWSNYFTFFKHFDISFAARAIVGSDVLNVTKMVFSNSALLPSLNVLNSALTEFDGKLTDQPKISSYYLEDGSFFRIDNLTLGYTMDVSKLTWIKKFRVSVVTNNLLLLTKYTGLDPEVSYEGLSFGLEQYNVYPKTKTFTIGVNLTF
ncbi:MAG TPA: hypothetical protein DCQ31_09205 [Bacteroidales bacterium]|nr:hypothetical protein [Bacteroidales bacterium]